MSVPEKITVRPLGYKPAVVRKTSEVYVEYYVINPLDHSWMRKRIRLNHVADKKTERVRYAEKVALEINRKLENGWNPYIEHEAPRAFTPISEAFDTFMRSREKEFRPATIRMYKSFIEALLPWLKGYFRSDIVYVVQVDKLCASSFMQYVQFGKGVSVRTWNNYLNGITTIFNWMIEYNYHSINPFAGIRKKAAPVKRRMYLNEVERAKVKKYLEANNRPFLRVVLMSYFTLLRRLELTKLKVGDIDLKKGLVRVWSENTKNKRDAVITIPAALRPWLEEMKLDNYPKGWQLFGHDFLPAKIGIPDKRISDIWLKMRKDLRMSARIQFMSLRDTGIKNLLASGVQIDDVMKHARHHSLEVTKTYLVHDDAGLIEAVNKAGDF